MTLQERQRARDEMTVGDRIQVALDVEVLQLNNGRARLQFKTDNGTLVRFWYGMASMPTMHTLHDHDPHALTECLGASAKP
jgi:hypothetical protein